MTTAIPVTEREPRSDAGDDEPARHDEEERPDDDGPDHRRVADEEQQARYDDKRLGGPGGDAEAGLVEARDRAAGRLHGGAMIAA